MIWLNVIHLSAAVQDIKSTCCSLQLSLEWVIKHRRLHTDDLLMMEIKTWFLSRTLISTLMTC